MLFKVVRAIQNSNSYVRVGSGKSRFSKIFSFFLDYSFYTISFARKIYQQAKNKTHTTDILNLGAQKHSKKLKLMKISVLRENDEIDYVVAYFNLTQLHCTDWLARNCTEETMIFILQPMAVFNKPKTAEAGNVAKINFEFYFI